MNTTDSKLNSVELAVTKSINLPNNPIDADFIGKTLLIVFNEELMNAGMLSDKLKKESEIVVTFAQYAIPPDGKVVDGANLREIYYYENGKYYDIRGKAVDVIPASDEEFVTKPQIEVPVDLEIERFEQQQVDEGHKPWRLDPIQTTITFVSLKISPEGVEGPFPVKEEDIKIIQPDFKSEEMWKGTLNGKEFELAVYQNTPFQVFILKYGDEERINILQDFYYTPWVFYGESIRFQQLVKEVGISYNITSREFSRNKMQNEMEIFDAISYDLRQLRQNNDLASGNEVRNGGNKARLLDEHSLIIK